MELQVNANYDLAYKEINHSLWFLAGDVKVAYNEATGEYFVRNVVTDTAPSIIHGNGPSKILLNNFGNYLAGAFKYNKCHLCNEQKIEKITVCTYGCHNMTVND